MNASRRLVVIAVVLGFALSPVALGKDKSEAEWVAQLASSNERDVTEALQGLEKQYPDSAVTKEKVIQLLKDPREKVHRKAARVAGALHFDLSADQMKDVLSLLESPAKETVIDGLKALRGLKSKGYVARITPLLANPDENIKRDACRTLAEIGDASVIPQIEPLLNDSNKKVQEDARDAIGKLKLK